MAFCTNCGAAVHSRFCEKCGTPASASSPAGTSTSQAGLRDNVAGALAYSVTVITGILFLVLEPYNRSTFVRFHAFQSIFLFVALFALSVGIGIFSLLLPGPLAFLGGMITFGLWVGSIAAWVICMLKAYQGEKFRLPMIGDLAEAQASK